MTPVFQWIPLTLICFLAAPVLSQASTLESLGEPVSEFFSFENPGSVFNINEAPDAPNSDGLGNDFTTLEMRRFPEIDITVPETGPGAEAFYRSMRALTGRGRAGTQNILNAANSEFKAPDGKLTTRLAFIQEDLARAGLPPILAWMVAQESGFKDRALSRARAWGAWQFIVRTAERFDLDIKTTSVTVTVKRRGKRASTRTRTVQQCTGCQDLDQATRAAAEYLSEMYEGAAPDKYYQWKGWKTGMPLIRWKKDWALTMAAYNTGEHNVAKAIYRAGGEQKDFWSLRSLLHPQTQHYVPVILAWMRVGQDPKRFGF